MLLCVLIGSVIVGVISGIGIGIAIATHLD